MPARPFSFAAVALAASLAPAFAQNAPAPTPDNPPVTPAAPAGGVPQTPIAPPVTDAAAPSSPEAFQEVVVTGRQDNLVGIADTATQGTIGAKQLKQRPILRPGELLEAVPGVIVSQHSGEGKANQYYLRGFNLDHGTDFATTVDGIPINNPTHAHGQGYTDLNFLIPEIVKGIRYEKGAANAENGDFSSAGAAHVDFFDVLPQGTAAVTGGSFNYGRAVVADSPQVGKGHLLYALEAFHNDGPWVRGDDYRKGVGVLRYTGGAGPNTFSVTALGYDGRWNSTDQIALRAVNDGQVDRFGELDPSDGGRSHRYSLSANARREDKSGYTVANAYVVDYSLDLFSNFTYFLDNPVTGDQFHQADRRITSGFNVGRTLRGRLGARDTENEFGLQVRNDNIGRVGLYHTEDRVLTQRDDGSSGIERLDHVAETTGGLYYQNRTQWSAKFRTLAGVRGDTYRFKVNDTAVAADSPNNSGTATKSILSPKLSLIFGPFKKTEFYASGGYGFHSNDGRGTTLADQSARVTPLVRAKEAEVGVRTARIANLQSTLSLWYLHLDSELTFSGDAGDTEAGRPSKRTGIEFANFYTPTRFLTIDADFATSSARFTTDPNNEGRYVDGALHAVVAAGVSYDDPAGFFGSVRLRYFGPRPLTTDNTVRSRATKLVEARIGGTLSKNTRLSLDAFNLFNQKGSDIDYYYTSRLQGEPSEGVDDIHFHPTEKRSFRLTLTSAF